MRNLHRLEAAITGRVPPGVYRWRSIARPETVADTVHDAGWRCFLLDGRTIDDKPSFLTACARAMEFPGWFGRNWDALTDCLTDLSWAPAPGYVVLYDDVARFAGSQPGQWAVARDILDTAVGRWAAAGVPMFVLLRGAGGAAGEIPEL